MFAPEFANDISWKEKNKAKLQDLVNTICENASRHDLKVSTEEAKSMVTIDSPFDSVVGRALFN